MARILKDYPEISLKITPLSPLIDFERIFGNRHPVHIEVGSGKGTFLLNQALAYPNCNFLGIEWASRFYRWSVDRLGRWDVTNVRVMRADAAVIVANHIRPTTIDGFHIYFPDPWPKRKHNRRRFFDSENVDQMIMCLKSGGTINIATDHPDYYEQIKAVAAEKGNWLCQIPFQPPANANGGEYAGTNFEKRYLRQNKTIYAMSLKKIQTAPLAVNFLPCPSCASAPNTIRSVPS